MFSTVSGTSEIFKVFVIVCVNILIKPLLKAILCILFFASANLYANDDSLITVTRKITDKQERLAASVKLIDDLEIINASKAIHFISETEKLAIELGDIKALYILYNDMAVYWSDSGNYAKVGEVYSLALKAARQLQNPLLQIDVLRNLGDNARSCSDHHLALNYLFEAYEMAPDKQTPDSKAYTENRLAAVYFELLATYNTGNRYFDSSLSHVYYNKGINRWINKFYFDSTIYYAEKSLQFGYKRRSSFLIHSNLNILGAAYEAVGDYKKAYNILTETLTLAKDSNDIEAQIEILRNLSKVLWKKGERKEAIAAALEADSLIGPDGAKLLKKELYVNLAEFYSALGDYKHAYYYTQKAFDLSISIFDNDLKAKLLTMKAAQEEQVNAEKLHFEKQINFYITLVFAIIMFFVIVMTVLFLIRHRTLKRINFELQQLNETVVKQRDELNELNTSKDKFFSIIAHDLKSPMVGLTGYSDLLVDEYQEIDESERYEGLKQMNKSIHSLADLTQNLLKWAELQLQRNSIRPVMFDISKTAWAVSKTFEPTLIAKELTLRNDLPYECLVFADKDAMYSVLHNLVSNAIKFSHRGSTIRVFAQKEEYLIIIGITDGGKGVPISMLDKLFKLDAHVTSDGTEGEKGTGLGLLICKEMVERNGGSIWVENAEHAGATFYFSLPIAPAKA